MLSIFTKTQGCHGALLVRAEYVRHRANDVAFILGIIYLLSSFFLSDLFAFLPEGVVVVGDCIPPCVCICLSVCNTFLAMATASHPVFVFVCLSVTTF